MEPRIGDRERDEAVARLREHHAAGRLDLSEFSDRMTRALEARTRSDLAPLFVDLPDDLGGDVLGIVGGDVRGGLPAVRTPAPLPQGAAADAGDEVAKAPDNAAPAWFNGLVGAAFPIALIICFMTGWRFWWIILLPMVLGAFSSSWKSGSKRGR
ncbi:MAG TPA: DUF1707 domain-containing protein [Propionibacteriaceae bacterium]|nr:DUF1707 domain-containing protein [Propionibacteriaceae bacterium]